MPSYLGQYKLALLAAYDAPGGGHGMELDII